MNALLRAAHRTVGPEQPRTFESQLAAFQRQQEPSLSVVDCTGLILGNADLEASCDWLPTAVEPGGTPLPIYPTPADLDLIGGEK